MELVDAQTSLGCQLCPEGVFCTQNPCPVGTTTHRKLTTVQLSLQLPPSPHVTAHGANTEVKSLWGCAGLWAARLRRAGFPEGRLTPQGSGVLRDGDIGTGDTLSLVCSSSVRAGAIEAAG